jgi:hypothetical protein
MLRWTEQGSTTCTEFPSTTSSHYKHSSEMTSQRSSSLMGGRCAQSTRFSSPRSSVSSWTATLYPARDRSIMAQPRCTRLSSSAGLPQSVSIRQSTIITEADAVPDRLPGADSADRQGSRRLRVDARGLHPQDHLTQDWRAGVQPVLGTFWEGCQTLEQRTDFPPISESQARKVWGDMITSGSYAFNAAHCAAYGSAGKLDDVLQGTSPRGVLCASVRHYGEPKAARHSPDAERTVSKYPQASDWEAATLLEARWQGSHPSRLHQAQGHRGNDGASIIEAEAQANWDELVKIKGIGPKTIEKIKRNRCSRTCLTSTGWRRASEP